MYIVKFDSILEGKIQLELLVVSLPWNILIRSLTLEMCTLSISVSPHVFISISGVTGRGAGVPRRLLTRKFLLTYWEKRGKEKKRKGVKIEKKRRKIVKGKVENCKGKCGNVTKWGEWGEGICFCFCFCFGVFVFFFVFLFFFFASHFSKPLKFVLDLYHNGNFLPEKDISHWEKNQEK